MQSRKTGGRDKAYNDNNNDDNKETETDTNPPESQPR